MSVRLLIGDCRERLGEIQPGSVDSCVTDPPYHLTSSNRRRPPSHIEGSPYSRHRMGVNGDTRASRGFMGQQWDGGDVAFDPDTWAAVFRVLKPGSHLIAFSGTRTYHRMVCAIEDAGFEIRDQLAWIYGSGFPKSHDVSKQIDKARNDNADWKAVGAWLREQREIAGLKQKEVAAVWPSRTGGLTGCVANWELGLSCPLWEQWIQLKARIGFGDEMDAEVWRLNGRKGQAGEAWQTAEVVGECDKPRPTYTTGNIGGEAEENVREIRAANSDAAREWEGWGTALKPAWEPICLARKPLCGTVAANVLKHGTGAINIDGCRVEHQSEADRAAATPQGKTVWKPGRLAGDSEGVVAVEGRRADTSLGRWPANIIHDGSEEVLAGFPETHTNANTAGTGSYDGTSDTTYGKWEPRAARGQASDSGSAARFFYCAKATSEERGEGNGHPTVKPVDLMRWLVRLVTPKGGTVLDPFCGSGSTLIAADAEQFNAIGCELSPEYAALAEKRIRASAGLFAEVMAA